MRIDVGSIIAVLKTARVSYGYTPFVEHDGEVISLLYYVEQLEAAHASPVQSILMDCTAARVAVVRHEAGTE
jgi:hypothetical protein